MKIALILICALAAIVTPALGSRGAKTHGDACNVLTSAIQIFSQETNYAESCDLDKKLICAINKCVCPPSYNWEQNGLFQLIGVGGDCVSDGTVERYGLNGAYKMGGVFATIATLLVARLVLA